MTAAIGGGKLGTVSSVLVAVMREALTTRQHYLYQELDKKYVDLFERQVPIHQYSDIWIRGMNTDQYRAETTTHPRRFLNLSEVATVKGCQRQTASVHSVSTLPSMNRYLQPIIAV
eukprot:gb/GECG01016219.1/.p1 GENE.gb/GECG01016219.1/~~gb/GECG01016219.1/.p1  ORF type:complete len:116 (+),score=3.39 gb/GECG01016219.1/:1-348(+)